MYQDRIALYEAIERSRDTKVLAYVTGDRRGLETMMASEVVDFFVHHLDYIGVVEKISVVLYTAGGETLSAWSLVNLLHMFCDSLEVIIPSKCRSAGTLFCLGADNLVMTKQATLGPIDPSVNTPLNPQYPGGQPMATLPVSVENVNAFLDQAKGLVGPDAIANIFDTLAMNVHPLVLGQAFRARPQIRMLGHRLLAKHIDDEAQIAKILDFLCTESGSHDYTINRREARTELRLPIETPSWELYRLIKDLYDDISAELELTTPYEPRLVLQGQNTGTYTLHRALIESVDGGSHVFTSEGTIHLQPAEVQPGVWSDAIADWRQFEGWRHHNA